MTPGQFFLGIVTLLVATLVYRWQKNVDRETVSLQEMRGLLSRYAVLSHRLYLKQPYRGVEYSEMQLDEFFNISDDEIELYTLRDQIYVTAPEKVRNSVLKCDGAFRAWKQSFPQYGETDSGKINFAREKSSDFKFSHEAMLIVMRSEFNAHNQIQLPTVLKNLIGRHN